MLREITNFPRKTPDGFKRWFLDDEFFLLIFYDRKRNPLELQLIYDRLGTPRGLRWRPGVGSEHLGVEEGGGASVTAPATVFTTTSAPLPREKLLNDFRSGGQRIDPEVMALVERAVNEVR